jgi:hypothetical protein
MNIVMGKALEVFSKTCKKGKACGNACISALKNCASKKTGESTTQSTKKTGESTKKTGESTTQSTKKTGESTKKTTQSTKKTGESTEKTGESTKKTGESTKKTGESTKKTRGSTKKTGESTTQSTKKTGESTQPTKTTPVSYKADSSDHKALMNIGKDFSDQTIGKAVKAYEDAQAEKKNFFMDIETNNKKTKKGEWFKKDEIKAAKLDEKMLLARKELESAAEETLQKLKAHHKINREDAEKWVSQFTDGIEGGEDKKLIRSGLTDVYLLTGGRGSGIRKITADPSTNRSYANTREIVFASKLSRGRSTVFHEYAHHMEFENTQLAVASRKFIEDRATSSEIMKLNDITKSKEKYGFDLYGDDEMAFPGNFISPYVGKIYGSAGTSTEVISMGIEQFADPKQMVSFYGRDPGHFNFVLGAILHEN